MDTINSFSPEAYQLAKTFHFNDESRFGNVIIEQIFSEIEGYYRQNSISSSPNCLTEVFSSELNNLNLLRNETNARLFYQSLLAVAFRLEKNEHLEGAAILYGYLSEAEHLKSASHLNKFDQEVPTSIRLTALKRFQQLNGTSEDIGSSIEFSVSHLYRQIFEPCNIAGVLAGSIVGNFCRFFISNKLLGLVPTLLTRGPLGEGIAALAGIAAEIPSFVLGEKLARVLLRKESRRELSLKNAMLSGFIFVSSARVVQHFTKIGINYAILGNGLFEKLTRTIAEPISIYGGVMLAHAWQAKLKMRQDESPTLLLLNSLAVTLQVAGTGAIVHHFFPIPFDSLHERMRAEYLRYLSKALPTLTSSKSLRPAFAGVYDDLFSENLMMSLSAETSSMGTNEVSGVSGIQAQKIRGILRQFQISEHALDIFSFHRGYEIAQRFPERVGKTAFDFDEVYLDWALSLPDLFHGALDFSLDSNFPRKNPIFSYKLFQRSDELGMGLLDKLWLMGVENFLGGALRQHMQYRPGARAFQLGLRMGQSKNLIMITAGPTGRILLLANQDPAMKMIYFGKKPNESVTIDEVRSSPNIYTREHIVSALRTAAEKKEQRVPLTPLMESYIGYIEQYPKRGIKLKHPAIAELLNGRPFNILVDDSLSTYEMLSQLSDFTVLRPPSARPAVTANFTISTGVYLDRVGNHHYINHLADALGADGSLQSLSLAAIPLTPSEYSNSRFGITIPWTYFFHEYFLTGREAKLLGNRIRQKVPAELSH